MNVIKKRLIKKADTQNIHHVSNEVSIGLFKDLHEKLIDDGYICYGEKNTGKDIGAKGFFAVKENKIYLFEIYNYIYDNNKKTKKEKATMLKKPESIIICHELNDNGIIVNSKYKQYNNMNFRDAEHIIMSKNNDLLDNYKLLNSFTFQDAKIEASL